MDAASGGLAMSWNYTGMRNSITYQKPIIRVIDVSRRNYDAQRVGK
jgi:hypothetical protein